MKWFKHDTGANMDGRLQEVLLDYGLEGYGLYWYCLELIAGKVSSENITFELDHDARIIARNTGSTSAKVEEMMKYFVNSGLFENDNGLISCKKMAARIDKSMTSNPQMRSLIEQLNKNQTQLDGFVYLIEKTDGNKKLLAYKIGRSKNPTSRVNELSRLDENIGFNLKVVAKIKTDNCVSLETKLHRKFKSLNIYNEWFQPDKEIPTHIATLSGYDMTTSDYDMITSVNPMQDKIRLDKKKEVSDSCESPAADFSSSKTPYAKIIEIYHEVLPSLPKVIKESPTRKKAMKARHIGDLNQDLNQWRKYFEKIKTIHWMMGGNDRNWIANFDYLIKQDTMIGVAEGTKNDR